MNSRNTIWMWLLLLGMAYFAVAMAYYRFGHPNLTETELFLHIWDALRWR